MLLKFGPQKIFEIENAENEETEPLTVAEYIISELKTDKLESVDPVIKIVFDEYEQRMGDMEFDAKRFFINYPQEEVSRLSSDLLSEKYSEDSVLRFEKKKGGHFETESELLYLFVPKVLQEYKMKMVRYLRTEVTEKMKQAVTENDFGKVEELQREISMLNKIEKILSGKLGNRTVIF
jgi:DNA primase